MTDKQHLAVIGATGRTGTALVHQALERGHPVTVVARSPGKAARLLPDDATVVTGDASDQAVITAAIAEADVILDVSGPVRGERNNYRTRSTAAILAAIQQQDPAARPRLIHLTGAGCRHPGDRPGLIDRLVKGVMLVVARDVLRDSEAAAAAVWASDLDALVLRCPRLVEGEATGTYRTAPAVGQGHGMQITFADLATAVLDQAAAEVWPEGSPVVSA